MAIGEDLGRGGDEHSRVGTIEDVESERKVAGSTVGAEASRDEEYEHLVVEVLLGKLGLIRGYGIATTLIKPVHQPDIDAHEQDQGLIGTGDHAGPDSDPE